MFPVEGTREETLLNLYPLYFKPSSFTRFRPTEELSHHLLKKVRDALFGKFSVPTFLRKGLLYALGEVEEGEITFFIGEKEIKLKRDVTLRVEDYKEKELETLFRDFLEVLGLKSLWSRKRLRKIKNKNLLIYAEPYPLESVLDGKLLLLELRYRLYEGESLQTLLEKGKIKEEELKGIKVWVEGKDSPLRVKEVLKASRTSYTLLQRLTEESSLRLRKAWEELLRSPYLSEKYILLLSDGNLYPASLVHRKIEGKEFIPSPPHRLRKLRDLRAFYAGVLKHYGWFIGKEEKAHGRLSFPEEVVDAEGKVGKAKALKKFLKQCKPFLRREEFTLGVLAVEKPRSKGKLEASRRLFLKALLRMLREKGLKPRLIREEKVKVPPGRRPGNYSSPS